MGTPTSRTGGAAKQKRGSLLQNYGLRYRVLPYEPRLSSVFLEKLTKTYPADAIYLFGHGHQKFGVTGGHPDLLFFRDYLTALLAHTAAEIKAGKSKDEIMKLENLAGFPDLHVPPGRGNRLPSNLSVAYDELTSA